MAKTATASTMAPSLIAVDRDVFYEDLQEIAEAQNWSFAYRKQCHLNFGVGPAGWDFYPASACDAGGQALAAAIVDINSSGTVATLISTDCIFTAEAIINGLTLGAECLCEAANEVTVTYRFTGSQGTDTSTPIVCAFADNDAEVTVQYANLGLATLLNEWCQVEIRIQRTTGASLDNRPIRFRIQENDAVIAAWLSPLGD